MGEEIRAIQQPQRIEGAVRPILRWAGSKRALLGELVARAPREFDRYVEPFVGSACLFLALRPSRALLGDINRDLMNFYRTFRWRPHEVLATARTWPSTRESYLAIRRRAPDELTAVECAARFLYLNRLAFNGVYRTNRLGGFNVPMGKNGGSFPDMDVASRAARMLRRAQLLAGDFETTLSNVRDGDFVYLDPPYSRSSKGNWGVYGYGSFSGEDLDRFVVALGALDSAGARFLVSYTSSPDLLSATSAYRVSTIAVRTQVGGSARSRSVRRELLISNYSADEEVGRS
jgi:DNA adenine methylase